MRTAVGHGLVDPKKRERSLCRAQSLRRLSHPRKGIGLTFPNRDVDTPQAISGNASKLGDVGESLQVKLVKFMAANLVYYSVSISEDKNFKSGTNHLGTHRDSLVYSWCQMASY